MKKSARIAVIGHQIGTSKLPSEYLYLTRKSETELFQKINPEYSFKAPSYVWSEYAAWFENSEMVNDVEITGLLHYRCALNLEKIPIETFPIYLRSFFLTRQLVLLRTLQNFLIVGEQNIVTETVWGQFLNAHSEIESYLVMACAKYDNIMNHLPGTSTQRLKELRGYYPRNIFLTDTDFGKLWLDLSFKIAVELDSKLTETPNYRWGGFVIERIFTLFVEDYSKQQNIKVTTAKQIYFITPVTWVKIQLLRVPLIARTHRKKIKH